MERSPEVRLDGVTLDPRETNLPRAGSSKTSLVVVSPVVLFCLPNTGLTGMGHHAWSHRICFNLHARLQRKTLNVSSNVTMTRFYDSKYLETKERNHFFF